MMKRIVFYTGMAGMLLVCSCDKHNVLLAERAKLEAQILQCQQDLASLDAKARALGVDLTVAHTNVDMQTAQMRGRNTALEQELAALSSKCTEGEEAMKVLRVKLDAYKAKYVR